jgi:hypothetical protein
MTELYSQLLNTNSISSSKTIPSPYYHESHSISSLENEVVSISFRVSTGVHLLAATSLVNGSTVCRVNGSTLFTRTNLYNIHFISFHLFVDYNCYGSISALTSLPLLWECVSSATASHTTVKGTRYLVRARWQWGSVFSTVRLQAIARGIEIKTLAFEDWDEDDLDSCRRSEQ